jgi:desulfoferrodoxin-like iron-binding protein
VHAKLSLHILKIAETYNPDPFLREVKKSLRRGRGRDRVVNVQNTGEIYRLNLCGNVVLVSEAGGGELICHSEPMQLVGQAEKPG